MLADSFGESPARPDTDSPPARVVLHDAVAASDGQAPSSFPRPLAAWATRGEDASADESERETAAAIRRRSRARWYGSSARRTRSADDEGEDSATCASQALTSAAVFSSSAAVAAVAAAFESSSFFESASRRHATSFSLFAVTVANASASRPGVSGGRTNAIGRDVVFVAFPLARVASVSASRHTGDALRLLLRRRGVF